MLNLNELADCSGHTHLDLCHAAIDKQLVRSDKAAVIGSEKDNSFGDLVGRATRPNGISLACSPQISTALH